MGDFRHLAGIFAVALAAGPAFAAAPVAGAGSSQIIPQITWRSWEQQDGDASGWQIVAPLSLTMSTKLGEKLIFDGSIRGAHITSDYENIVASTPVEGHISTFSDTTLGGTFTYLGIKGLEPFLTIDMNLPTGTATLHGEEKNAIMDPDLVDQIRFGEGFNINPSIGAAYELSNRWVLSAAVGYNTRGSYVPDGDIPSLANLFSRLSYDPGDQLTGYVRAQYLDETSFFAAAVKYFDEEMSTLGGIDYFNPGDRIEVTVEGTTALTDSLLITGYGLFTTSESNQYLNFFTLTTVDEEANGNGDVYYASLALIYTMEEVDLSFGGSYMMRDENDYDPVNDLFIAQRTAWDAGPGIDWRVAENAVLSANVRFGELYDDPTPFIPTETTYTKLSSFVSGTWTF